MKIPTKDTEGRDNGWICPVWNALEHPELRPEQVYVTAIAPRSRKGPHLHMKRRGLFFVISGKVVIMAVYPGVGVKHTTMEPGDNGVIVNSGAPCALYNYGDTEALVLNLPSPAWSKENPDDWPVEGWKDPEDWPPVIVPIPENKR